MISAAENSNKFQKIRFWKEKLVGDVVTTAQATLLSYDNSYLSYAANSGLQCPTCPLFIGSEEGVITHNFIPSLL